MTKRLLMVAIAGLVLAGSLRAMAGGACCPADKETKAGMKADYTAAFAKLNLTDEQKTKLAALQAECNKAGGSKEGHEQFMKGVDEVLTPEQRAQWKEQCQQEQKSGKCPFAGKDSKS